MEVVAFPEKIQKEVVPYVSRPKNVEIGAVTNYAIGPLLGSHLFWRMYLTRMRSCRDKYWRQGRISRPGEWMLVRTRRGRKFDNVPPRTGCCWNNTCGPV
jgi:hypothetical protein